MSDNGNYLMERLRNEEGESEIVCMSVTDNEWKCYGVTV